MKRLTLGILAHVDAGKTTLSEGLLFSAGGLQRLGRVDKKDAFLEIAKMAKEQNTGARGLRAIMEGFMQKMMYELPDRRDVKKAVITAAVVRGEASPKLVLRKSEDSAE